MLMIDPSPCSVIARAKTIVGRIVPKRFRSTTLCTASGSRSKKVLSGGIVAPGHVSASGVDQHVDTAETGHDLFVVFVERRPVQNIRRISHGTAPCGRNLRSEALARRKVAVQDDNLRTLLGKVADHGRTQNSPPRQ